MVSAGDVRDTRGSGIVSGAADVLGMSDVHGMIGIGSVLDVYVIGSGRRGWRGW